MSGTDKCHEGNRAGKDEKVKMEGLQGRWSEKATPTDTPEMQQGSEASDGMSRADTWGRGFETEEI